MTADMHTMTGAFAMNALDEEERALFNEHLAQCAACRREVDEFWTTVAHLGSAAAETPPAGLKAALMAEIDTVRQDTPVVQLRTARRDAAPRWTQSVLSMAAAVFAVMAIGLGIFAAGQASQVSELQVQAAGLAELLAASDTQTIPVEGSNAKLVVNADRNEVALLGSGMPAAGEGQTYEFWLISTEGEAIPAGLFDASEDGIVQAFASGSLDGIAAVGVTVEPAGGSDVPTTTPIMVINL